MIDDSKRDEARRERAERAFKRREEGAQAMTEKAVIVPIKAESGRRPPSKKRSVKAAEMAGNEIDRLGDRSATDEQRASRKRRLLKGPKEFRNIRDENARRG
jgi:hypothetical protein